jgi:hypothetical protein
MTNQELGISFEVITKNFFVSLLEKIGFTVTKARAQKSGSQNGFDILIIVSKNYIENKIFIECKNYESDLAIGNIVKKGLNLESNYYLDENDLFIAINPRSNFSNEDNSEKLSPILSNKFPFSYYALDLSNGIRELFALDKIFYKELYGKDVDFVIDEDKEIARFESIIFSRKPFKKTIIKAEDKIKFIGEISLDKNYIERTLSEELRKESNYFKNNSLTLSEIVNKNSSLFILGNPGSGKSTELKKLALSNWREGEVDNYTPIFKSLKNFSITDTIDSFLPINWMELNNVLLILDGIDEISDIESFKSKFQNFIENNSSSKKNIKYLISCRTNIYESIVIGLPSFKTFYLQDLTYDQGIELLNKKCNGFNLNDKFNVFLKNPYLIDILADYISEKNEPPTSTANLWKVYIEKRLAFDKKNKLVKVSINPLLIKKYSKKTSLINELMKTNVFDEDSLFLILKEKSLDFIEFKKNPLLERLTNEDTWFFEHRNIQEYFAALALSELSFEKIKDFIVITGTDKTHPSLFNTVAFLLNILDSDKYNQLVNWLIVNELELLFKADSDKTTNFKIQVFRDYFKRECIEKGFWINTNKTFSVLEIAQFSDCEKNLEYLLEIIKETKDQPRVVISALNLLCFFTIPFTRKNEVKELFIEILKDVSIENRIKSQIINCITTHKFCEEEVEYLNLIFELFKLETNKEINSALLFLIRDIDNVDSLFWYLKEEFLRVNKIVKRNDIDDVHRGNSWVLNELIFKLKNSNFFIELITYHFIREFNLDLSNDDAIKVLKRCLLFSNKEDDFIVRFLTTINGKTEFYKHERLLQAIISESNSQLKASKYLVENNPFSNVRVLLASIANTKVVELVKDCFVLQQISSEEINLFRHNLWVYNRGVSYEFDLLMRSEPINFKFDNPLLSEEELTKQQMQNNSKFQHNFDILFKKDELLKEIEIIFQENNLVIDQNKIRKIESNWYEKNGSWSNTIDTSIKLLSTLVYHYKETISFLEVQEILENDFIRYNKIKTLVKENVNSNIKFVVSDEQKASIIDWSIKSSLEIKFDNFIIIYDKNSFNYGQDYEKFMTIMDFQEVYEFELSQDFLLDCLECFEVDKFEEDDDIYGILMTRIKDQKKFNERIVNNILNKKMFKSVMDRHVSYALNHNLNLTFPQIRNYFKDNFPRFNLDAKLEKYIELTGDFELLKECCEDVKTPKCWSSIKILLKLNKEVDFCIAIAIEYLEVDLEYSNKFYLWDALGVLFQQNRKEAIVYYYSLLKEDRMSQMYFSNYSAVDYDTLEKLFFKTYGKESDKSVFNDSGAFLSSYISNLSKDDESYDKTQKVLFDIKAKLIKEFHDTELFYINLLIDNSKTSYINSKSKPMSFTDALRKVEEIIC